MKPTKLSQALRQHADMVEDGETAELVRVLARIVEGRSIDQAFGAPGDWGYHQPIGAGVFDLLKTLRVRPEAVEWHYLPELPNDAIEVLVAIDNPESDQVIVSRHENGAWFFPSIAAAFSPFKVYAWAYLPTKPGTPNPEPSTGGQQAAGGAA